MEYLSLGCVKYDRVENVDLNAASYEYVMLRLRLKEGFSLSDYKAKFGVDFIEGREELLSKLHNAGYINVSEDRISLTERGFYISNLILTELI
jgi:oxygen-independent coproporphyrinogen-3 oxidase